MNCSPRLVVAALVAATSLSAQTPTISGASQALPQQLANDPENVASAPVPGQTKLPSFRTPIHTASSDSGVAYGTWAAADTYKASFHDGMTFIPYLGTAAPTTQSLGWTTASVRLGNNELLTGNAARHANTKWRYEYQFGAVTEAYDVRAEGLEQTFVLYQRPTGGDLVIRGTVSSTLHSPVREAGHQPLVFSDDQGRAVIEYGSAIAFDSNGARVLVTTEFANNTITLTVPGNWVEQAALPITVDPLLTRVMVTTGTSIVTDIDTGRDDQSSSDNVAITYVRAASNTDRDLWVLLRNDDYSAAPNTLIFSDVTTSWDTDQTSCAFVGGASRWAFVFRRYFPNAIPRSSRLRCHVHQSGDDTFLTNYGLLPGASGINQWRPDVGGVQAFASGDQAMVVFQTEDNTGGNNHFAPTANSNVQGCLLDVTSNNGTFGTPFTIKPNASYDHERPSINQVAKGGGSFSWVCVFQSYHNAFGNQVWDLMGVRIGNDGTVAAGTWQSDLASGSPDVHQLGPKVEGAHGRYAVLFATIDHAAVPFKTTLITGNEMKAERFDWTHGAANPSGDQSPVLLRGNGMRIFEATGIGFDTDDKSHWACGYRSVPPGSGTAYSTVIGYQGEISQLGYLNVLHFGGDGHATGPACVYNNDDDEFQFAYAVEGPVFDPVFGHTLTYTTAPPVTTSGISCSNASLSWLGTQQIGAEFSSVRVSGAPPAAIHIMLAATATTDVPVIHPVVFPGCRLFVMAAGPGYLGTFPTGVGSDFVWQLPLPEALGSQTLHFQDWYLDANALLYSTERLSVPIVQ